MIVDLVIGLGMASAPNTRARTNLRRWFAAVVCLVLLVGQIHLVSAGPVWGQEVQAAYADEADGSSAPCKQEIGYSYLCCASSAACAFTADMNSSSDPVTSSAQIAEWRDWELPSGLVTTPPSRPPRSSSF